MAVISGFYGRSGLGQYDSPYLSTDLEDYTPAWINDLVEWISPRASASTLINNLPVSAAPRVLNAWRAKAYVDDFYYRIHIIPRVLDIGNLLSVQTRDVSVWNAWLTPQALGSIGESGTTGLTESGITAPTTFAPLEERIYSVTVDTAGPATVAALYTFNFPLESPTLEVTGRRVVVFGHAPDWTKGLIESYKWLTDVNESYGGIEQRIGLRAAPRRVLTYTFNTFSERERASLAAMLYGWQSRIFAVPVWTDTQVIAAPVAAGTTSIPCATSGYEFAPGGLVVLWTAFDSHEALEIESVGAGVLNLASPVLGTWPAGTELMPVRLGRLPDKIKSRREMAFYMAQQVAFDMIDHPGWPATDAGDIYLGYRVHNLDPRFVSDISIDYVRSITELDYKTGEPWVKDKSGYQTEISRWKWILRDRDEIVAFRSWLAARDGRRVPFWSETEGADLKITATIGSSDTSIQVENVGYHRYIAARADRRHLAIRTFAGAVYYRQITGSAEIDTDTESLAIDSALGAVVTPAEVASVRFLRLSRLEADAHEIDWHTLVLAESTGATRSVIQ